MNTRSRKALSPVVASIILIAVTVAVSIAVAAWMGALSFNFMNTEQLSITSVAFTDTGATVTVSNSGSTDIALTTAYVTPGYASTDLIDPDVPVPNNSGTTVNLAFTWTPGSTYQIKLMSTKGNSFTYSAVAP